MKTKVIIENGKTEIVLTPENDFEKNVLERLDDKKCELHAEHSSKYQMGGNSDFKITILVIDK